MVEIIGKDLSQRLKDLSMALYEKGLEVKEP
jgi:hypothetical protein